MIQKGVGKMNSTLKQLLQQMIAENEALIQYGNDKREYLIANNIEGLSKIILKEQRHVMALAKLDEMRKVLIYQLLSGKPLKSILPTVTDCYAYLHEEEQKDVQQAAQTLLDKMLELRQVNDLNQQLIQQSLQFVNMSLSLFEPTVSTVSYGDYPNRNHPKKTKVRTSLFDSKI